MPAPEHRFPANLDSVSGADPFGFQQVENFVSTLLNGDHLAGATTITVDSTAQFPARGYVVIDAEIISYTGKTATTFTGCTRGDDGTTAAAHSDNTSVLLVPLAANHNDVAGAVVAVETKLGIGASTPVNNTALTGNGDGSSAWSGSLDLGDGSTGNPTYGFGSDPDTGVRLAAAGDVRVVTSGVDRLAVSDAGADLSVPLSMSAQKITDLADPTVAQDAATMAYVDAEIVEHAGLADPHPGYTTAAELATGISTHAGEADPHTGYQKESEKGAVGGYASLDGSGLVPDAQIPSTIARDSEVTSAISTHAGEADPHTGYLQESILDAKGDLIAASADNTPVRRAVGTDGQYLVAASGQASGLNWQTHDSTGDPHTQYATDTDLSTHAGAADPHAGYVLESLVDAKGDIVTATADNAPARLAVGSNGQVLTAQSGQATGLQWATHDSTGDPHTQYALDTDLTTHAGAADPHAGYVLESIFDAKGDILAASADNTPARRAVGTDGQHLVADSGQASGLNWQTHDSTGDPHTQYQKESEKGAASGYASLDGSTKVPIAELPTGTSGTTVALGNHGHTSLAAELALTGDISPAQITADQNDYSPTGLATASTLRLSSDAARNITGLAGGADGRLLLVHNVGAQNIVLKDESASSTAANRFALSADLTIAGDQGCWLQYDATSSRWRVPAAASGSGGHTIQDEGSALAARTGLNFVGAGVTATDDAGNNRTVVTIPGGGVADQIAAGGGSAVFNGSGKLTITPASGQGVEFASGTIGIGTAPTADKSIKIVTTLSPAAGTVYGMDSFLNVNPSAAIDEVRAISGWVELRGTNAVTGKNVTNVYGMLFGASTNADYDSNITNYYAIYAEQFFHSGAGTIDTTYGVFIEPSTVGTTNWSLYVNGSTSKSFVGGTVRIDGNVGIATAPHATRIFHVGGSRSYTSDTVVFEVDTAIAISGAAQYIEAFSFDAPFNPSVAVSGIGGVLSRPRLVGTNGVTTPTTFDFYATYFQPQVDATYDAAITNAYGVWSGAPAHAGAGTITNYYGVFVDAPATQTNITNVWGVYVTAAKSYFGGNIRIDGNVGIGTAPIANTALAVYSAIAPASGTAGGVDIGPTFTPSGAMANIVGLTGYAYIAGTEGVTTNPITNLYGMYFGAETLSNFDSAITNYYGIFVERLTHAGGGAVTTSYGIFINDTTAAATNWGLWVDGTIKNFIGGALGVGIDPSTTAKLYVSQGTITTDINAIRADVTWNAGGVTFTAIEVNVTDTASAAASLLMNLDGLFQVRKDGAPIIVPAAGAGKLLESDANGVGAWVARPFTVGGTLLSPATGTTVMAWRAPFACTVTAVRGHFKGGTSVVYNARKNQASNLLSANRTNSTADAWDDGTAGGASLQNTAFAAGDDLEIMFVTITGAVTEASIQVEYTRP
jgi:hypothetical protein